ncbi:MAG TPA: bifunctional riboflavin kinase/FAD synthetase [Epsilonproteobacteria bacterium]|nr:bifunctional riboflavin kinase/FAD synthetase [Campylobacterota bacterium]
MAYTNTIQSIAIGSFDGMHIAHQTLAAKADALVIIERDGGYLTPGHKRANFISKVCCFYHFDVIKGLTPQAFVQRLKTDFPQLATIVVGYDFAFGKDKAGTAQTLRTLFDGKVEIVQEVSVEGVSVHSRTIKAYLREGNIAMANKLLGRTYSIDGEVVSGQGLGKKELVPTLNLNVKAYQLPLEGVYATRTKVKGEWLPSVSFLGHRVTTDDSFAVETHILGHDIGEVKGKVEMEFVDFIRANQKFESLEALKQQIVLDIQKAKECLC